MLWFFQRQKSRLQLEIRRQADGDGFELVITHPDGNEEIERYNDPGTLVMRSRDLQNTLVAAGWRPPDTKLRTRLRAS